MLFGSTYSGKGTFRQRYGRVADFVRDHAVFVVALVAALASIPLAGWGFDPLNSVDLKTIACLFCILGSVGLLGRAGFFERVAALFGRAFPHRTATVCALVATTMVLSMFVTNDMALVVMLPLAAAVLRHEQHLSLLPFTFIMQNLAANLGGMILPFGNPQNLYLYGRYGIQFGEFLAVMALPFAASVLLIGLMCLVAPTFGGKRKPPAAAGEQPEPVAEAQQGAPAVIPRKTLALTTGFALLALSVLAVFRVVPYGVATMVVFAVLLVLDRKVLRHLDWFLLGTFVCFFIFAGNVSANEWIRNLLAQAMVQAPLVVSAAASQLISNVPAAILLSQVCDAWQPLLQGVNIGSAGTMVASLASLITIDRYRTLKRIDGHERAQRLPATSRFTWLLMAYGFVFLILLTGITLVFSA